MIWSLSGGRIALLVDEAVYPAGVVARAAYVLTDRAYVFVHHVEGELAVVLQPKSESASLQALVGELANALLDQRIRADLAAEFGGIQAAIVAEAFAPVAHDRDPVAR